MLGSSKKSRTDDPEPAAAGGGGFLPPWLHLDRTKTLIIPFFALIGLLLVALTLLVMRSVNDQNRQARENSVHVAEAVFRSLGRSLEITVRDYSWWREAITKTVDTFDAEWAAANIGAYIHKNNDVTVTLVLDRDDHVRYAVVDSEVKDATLIDSFGPGLLRIAERARASPHEQPQPASAYIRFGDEIHLAAAGAMTPEDLEDSGPVADPRPVMIFTRRISPERLAELADNFLLPGLALVRPGEGRPILHPLRDAEDATVAGLTWEVPEPGTRLLRDLALPATVVSVVVVALMVVVCRGILASARTLQEQNRRLAEGEAIAVRALGEVAAVNQQKSWFLAQMSHELRTPLNAIMGFSDVMATGVFGPLQPRYQDYARNILSSAGHLLSLVNDLLDLSKIEAGALYLVREEVALPAIIRSSLSVIEREAEKERVFLDAVLPSNLPKARADAKAVRQILINLLANAVKFTPSGGWVTVSAWAPPQGGVGVQIADTGIGMSPEDLELALKPFGRAATPFVQARQGTGLGLPISKHLAEAQGALFEITSQPGVGTSIRIVFPEAVGEGVTAA